MGDPRRGAGWGACLPVASALLHALTLLMLFTGRGHAPLPAYPEEAKGRRSRHLLAVSVTAARRLAVFATGGCNCRGVHL